MDNNGKRIVATNKKFRHVTISSLRPTPASRDRAPAHDAPASSGPGSATLAGEEPPPYDPTLQSFATHLKNKRYSPYTVRNYLHAARQFSAWFNRPLDSATPDDISVFATHWDDRSTATLHHTVAALRTFIKFLYAQTPNKPTPIFYCKLPKIPKHLPHFLTQTQTQSVVEQHVGHTPFHIHRNALILELLYCAGIRVGELAQLRYTDVDTSGLARILGKGNKERLVPIGEVALRQLHHFRAHHHAGATAHTHLITGQNLLPLSVRQIQNIVRTIKRAAGITSKMTPHTLRHTYATHMLINGADLRSIQALLGHSNLATTQIYTHLDIQHLRKVHTEAHPRA